MTFDSLGLAEPLRLALEAEKHLKPTPIQIKAIPVALEGRDLLAVAQTGSGKTAAFTLPLLHRLAADKHHRVPGSPRALILAPTRELASQIVERIHAYGRRLKLNTSVIFGGVPHGKQIKALKAGTDIVVATPGRLLELLNNRHIKLDRLEVLVLDEADRMFDMGFIRDIRKIVRFCPKQRQTLLFSATMPPTIAELAKEVLHDAQRIEISPEKVAVDRIRQQVYFVGAQDKRKLLADLIDGPETGQAIVFTRTKRGADRVCRGLVEGGTSAVALHGNKAQGARVKALEGFRSGKVRVLVATDIAARGIDIPGISHVINYELPNEPESYVHRIGRTARAGASGIALSFCDAAERPYLKAIERLTRVAVEAVDHPLAQVSQDEAPRRPAKRGARGAGPARKRRRPGKRPVPGGRPFAKSRAVQRQSEASV
ncbi:DEAD/DEAH box helicase [Methyloligella solikamskensis]|uniref:DEAD/DEAH box helicase n=1 Tax=Methyloligella solikamskensis TaxID=1177756 RepID=A0ABW3J933_9HYPH